MNGLTYKYIGFPYGDHFEWTLEYDGFTITGTGNSVRQCYRKAKRALKRHKKALKWLEG